MMHYETYIYMYYNVHHIYIIINVLCARARVCVCVCVCASDYNLFVCLLDYRVPVVAFFWFFFVLFFFVASLLGYSVAEIPGEKFFLEDAGTLKSYFV